MARGVLLTEWMTRRGAIAHTADARAAGFSDRDMREAVASGALRRVRRSWLVGPGCDHRIEAAASVSGRVSCVSAAARHGLWAPPHTGIHVAVASTASRFDADGLTVHWARGPVPTSRTALEDPPVNMLFQVARCLPRRDALMVWESALRKQLVSPERLRRVNWRSRRAAELASIASLLSDSGLETAFLEGLRPFDLPVRQQVRLEGHPVDLLIGERLVIQIDGFEFHSRPADRRRDIAHDAALTLSGYTVLRFDYQQILFEWDAVARTVLDAVAQGLHRVR
jgi:very-short-patch-repair endonuclease